VPALARDRARAASAAAASTAATSPSTEKTINAKLGTPNAERIFFLRHAFLAGYTVDRIFDLTKIDRWFLHQLREIYEMERELAGRSRRPQPLGDHRRRYRCRCAGRSSSVSPTCSSRTSSRPIFAVVRAERKKLGVNTTYRLVDTCAAEFEAFTPYYYSSYGDENEVLPPRARRRS
jgi:carbamoyl-phosphate synthase large subunit